MKPKTDEILRRAIEEGLAYGWTRSHKHTDKPEREAALREIETAIWASIYDVFDPDPGP